MARARVHGVIEKRSYLIELQRAAQSSAERARLDMLLYLSEAEAITFEAAALKLGASVATLKRWWKIYRDGGLASLVPQAIADRSKTSVDPELDAIAIAISDGTITTVDGLRSHLGLDMRVEAKAPPLAVPLEFLDFLNRLPVAGEMVEWIETFRESLKMILPDVDRISIRVNMSCNLEHPELTGSELTAIATQGRSQRTVRIIEMAEPREMTERIIASIRSQGFPMENYHPPVVRPYYFRGVGYLGAIVFWRDIARKPMPDDAVRIIDRLEPFFTFSLSDAVARHSVAQPAHLAFMDNLQRMRSESGLTPQEHRVIVQLLMGADHGEVAAALNISKDTVRFHLRSIYRKTRTRSMADLFAKYFTPRRSEND